MKVGAIENICKISLSIILAKSIVARCGATLESYMKTNMELSSMEPLLPAEKIQPKKKAKAKPQNNRMYEMVQRESRFNN